MSLSHRLTSISCASWKELILRGKAVCRAGAQKLVELNEQFNLLLDETEAPSNTMVMPPGSFPESDPETRPRATEKKQVNKARLVSDINSRIPSERQRARITKAMHSMKKEQLRAAAESRRSASAHTTFSVAQNNSPSHPATVPAPASAPMWSTHTSQPQPPRRFTFRPFATFTSSSRLGLGNSNYVGTHAYSYFQDENIKVHPVRTAKCDKTEPETGPAAEPKPKTKAKSKGKPKKQSKKKPKKKPEMEPIYLEYAYLWYYLVRHMVFDEGMDTYKLTGYCCPKALVWMVVRGWVKLDDVVEWRPARQALGEGLVELAEISRSTELLNGTYPTKPPAKSLEKPTQEQVNAFQCFWHSGKEFNCQLRYNWRKDREDRDANGPFGEKVRQYATPCVQEKILKTLLQSDAHDIREDWKQIFGLLFDAKKGNFPSVNGTSSGGKPTAAPSLHDHAQPSNGGSASLESDNEAKRKRKRCVTLEDADDEDEQGPKKRFASEGKIIERATPEPEGSNAAPTSPAEGGHDQVPDVSRTEIDVQVSAVEKHDHQQLMDNTIRSPSPVVNNDMETEQLFPDVAAAPTTADASMEDIEVPSVLEPPHAPAPTATQTDEMSMDVEMLLDASTTGPAPLQNDKQGETSAPVVFSFGQGFSQTGTGKRLKHDVDAMETVPTSATPPANETSALPSVLAPAQAQHQAQAQPVSQEEAQPVPQQQTQTQAFAFPQPAQMQEPQSAQSVQPSAQPVAQPVTELPVFKHTGGPVFTIGAEPATSRDSNTRVRRAMAFRTKRDIERMEKERARRPRRRADASQKVSK